MKTGERAILQIGDDSIELFGRTLAIVLEIIDMREEINETKLGEVKISWKERSDLRVAFSKFLVKSMGWKES